MPQIVDLTQPYGGRGKYGDAFAGIAGILDTIGKVERLRQDRALNSKIINLVSQGMGTPQNIAKVLVEAQPQYSTGAAGFLQQIASQFAPPSMIESQVAGMGIESAFQTMSPSQMMALERWNKYKEAVVAGDKDTADRLLSSALVNINVPTSRELWDKPKRGEVADVEFSDKVELSSAERTTAKKGVEDVFESTPLGAGRLAGWHYGVTDYKKPTVIDMYKQWLTEQGYDKRTPRQKKSLDDIWDGKMALMNKMGYKFKTEGRGNLTKNEIWWDPNDPEVKKLRGGVGQEMQDLRTTPTGGDVIGTLQGTPAQRGAIDAIVKRPLSPTDKQALINQILNNERIMVKDNTGKIYTLPVEQLVDWLAISGNTLAAQDRRK